MRKMLFAIVVLAIVVVLFLVARPSQNGQDRKGPGVSPIPEAPTKNGGNVQLEITEQEGEVNQGEESGPFQSKGEDLSAEYNLELWAVPEFYPLDQGMERVVYFLTGRTRVPIGIRTGSETARLGETVFG